MQPRCVIEQLRLKNVLMWILSLKCFTKTFPQKCGCLLKCAKVNYCFTSFLPSFLAVLTRTSSRILYCLPCLTTYCTRALRRRRRAHRPLAMHAPVPTQAAPLGLQRARPSRYWASFHFRKCRFFFPSNFCPFVHSVPFVFSLYLPFSHSNLFFIFSFASSFECLNLRCTTSILLWTLRSKLVKNFPRADANNKA